VEAGRPAGVSIVGMGRIEMLARRLHVDLRRQASAVCPAFTG
jgi:hypothetical protein